MRLAPDDDEVRIAGEARKLLTSLAPISRLHGTADAALGPQAWAALADHGWLELLLPTQADGAGLSEVEFGLFFREVGRLCAPLEVLTQSLALLLAVDRPELRQALRTGQRVTALLVSQPELGLLLGSRCDVVLEVDARAARLLAVDGCGLELVSSLDPATPMHALRRGTPVLIAEESGPRLWRLGQLGVAAMLTGLAESGLEQMVQYARIRHTFGKPIGVNQAVRHPCAEAAVRLEAARCQLWFAAAAAKEGRADAGQHLLAAKHAANECAAFTTDLNIQIHGGIGVTEEHDAHIFLKHALLLRRLFGSKRALLRELLHAQVGV